MTCCERPLPWIAGRSTYYGWNAVLLRCGRCEAHALFVRRTYGPAVWIAATERLAERLMLEAVENGYG